MKENAFTHYVRDEELYGRFKDAAREDKLPILDNKTFERYNKEYGKEKMRTTLADYIATERPVFPLKEITKDDMRKSFFDLQKFDTSTICIPNEQVEKTVFEKYDDYKYSYEDYGLGLINGASTFNDVSNHFMQDLRLECGSYGFRAPKEVWENGSAYDGTSSIKVSGENMLVGVSTEIISKSYDLSSFSSPAIKFSWAGAALNTFPVNELEVTYSDDCGESWKSLQTIGAVEASNAGLYTSSFRPSVSEWNTIILTKAQLKNSNIRFKFEYIVNGRSNNFYLDNILIGEESALQLAGNNVERLSLFPNPAKGNTIIALENAVDKNIEISLINILGSEITNLYSGLLISNYQEIPVDLSKYEKGIYFVKVVSNGDVIMTEKLVVNK